MALVNNGIEVLLNADKLPVGYTKPVVTTFTDNEYQEVKEFIIGKASVDDPVEVTTFTALVAQAVTDLGVAISTDFDTVGQTVTVYGSLEAVDHDLKLGEELYTNVALNYKCRVRYYVKAE